MIIQNKSRHTVSLLGLLLFLILAVGSVNDSGESGGSAGPTGPHGSSSTQWFKSGNLHSATVAQWKNASYQNKLATAADWLVATKWKGHLTSPDDFDRLKLKAQMLVNAVDEVIAGQQVDYLHVAEIAAALVNMSNDFSP